MLFYWLQTLPRGVARVLLPLLLVVDADAFEIPLVEAVDAFVDFYGVVPAKAVELAHVGEFEHGAVGLALKVGDYKMWFLVAIFLKKRGQRYFFLPNMA